MGITNMEFRFFNNRKQHRFYILERDEADKKNRKVVVYVCTSNGGYNAFLRHSFSRCI